MNTWFFLPTRSPDKENKLLCKVAHSTKRMLEWKSCNLLIEVSPTFLNGKQMQVKKTGCWTFLKITIISVGEAVHFQQI